MLLEKEGEVMGMFNEVTYRCIQCAEQNQIQIPQVVLGFGNFVLHDSSTTEDLEDDDRILLFQYIMAEKPSCESCSWPLTLVSVNHWLFEQQKA